MFQGHLRGMADITHDFPVFVPPGRVWEGITTPQGLDQWWSKASRGVPALGNEYVLDFGPGYEWKAVVTACAVERAFELELTDADGDWTSTRVGFALSPIKNGTQVRFHHTGWPEPNDHYRTSSFCWAMYLRILKRWLEHGEIVPYERRLDV